jgi:hypothetical protein
LVLAVLFLASAAPAQETIRSQAVLQFTFDQDSGSAKDSAKAGQTADEGKLVNDPQRVASPFWNQPGKKALQLDAGRQQYVEIADGPDVDRPDALTFSLLFVNLQQPNAGGFHGLIAKRGTVDGKVYTNYGINFTQQGDTLQVYLSDGGGYKVVQYSTQAAIPIRKLAFLTATYQFGDAPGQDADADADDVRIQLFANGEPLKPKNVLGGLLDGNDGWITDINPAGLANDLPVTIGRSEAAGEYTSGVIDEFLLFPTALSPEQVKQLFLEVAGANVRELMAQDGPAPAVSPVISGLSQPGIQVGQPTTLVISGANLNENPRIVLPAPNVKTEIVKAEPNRLEVNVAAAADAVPGNYPIWVETTNGMSAALPIMFDRLPQVAATTSGPDSPSQIPAAYFGTLTGSAQPKIYFAGKQGQRVVADVDLKRLGGQANPVVEIKTARGTPLAIGWGQHSLDGDARADVVLPKDGIYAVELHDLTYNAPGQSTYRLKIGDLKLMDAAFPAVAAPGELAIQPIGTGFGPDEKWTAKLSPIADSRYGLLHLPAGAHVDGGLPRERLSHGVEVVESAAVDNQPQTVDALFANGSATPVGINGRLQRKGEQDRYLLNVTPGQKLRFVLQTHSISSSVEGEIAIYQPPQGNALAMTGEQPTLADAVLDFTVPADQKQIVVGVRDVLNQGDERSYYRLEIAPAGRPDFEIVLNAPVIEAPVQGGALLELQVTRRGYDGPIALKILGNPGLKISPAELAAGISGKVLARISRETPDGDGTLPFVHLVGETVGIEPPVQRIAQLASGGVALGYGGALAVGSPPNTGLAMASANLPTVLFRGVTAEVPMTIQRQPGSPSEGKPVRFALITTEAPRQRQPNNPAAGNFPMVSLSGTPVLDAGAEQVMVPITTPLEVAEGSMEIALRAEATVHPYSERVLGTAVSSPARVQIQNAVAPKVDEPTLGIVTAGEHRVTGQLQRTAGFAGPVEVTLAGLPGDYQVTPASVPGDQGGFAIVVKAPKAAESKLLPDVKLRVTSKGSLLVLEQPVNAKALPPQ